MLDRLFVRAAASKDIFTEQYTPDQAITGRKLVNETGRDLHVLFPPWHGGGKAYEHLTDRLVKRGGAVLAYYFHDEILKPDAEQVRASYEYVRDTVAAELTELTGKHDYERVRLVAMSLGTCAMSMVSSKFADFDSATMVVTSSSLARSMWYGTRTHNIRTGLEARGHDLASVEATWRDLETTRHLDALAGKNLHLVVSTTDEVVPTSHQLEFLDAAAATDIELDVETTRLGHYAAVGKYCLSDRGNL